MVVIAVVVGTPAGTGKVGAEEVAATAAVRVPVLVASGEVIREVLRAVLAVLRAVLRAVERVEVESTELVRRRVLELRRDVRREEVRREEEGTTAPLCAQAPVTVVR